VLACELASASLLLAQGPGSKCTLSTDELRPIVLRDGSYGMVFPVEMTSSGDSLLILGLAVTADAAGKPIALAGDDSSLVGFLLTDRRRVATAIPAPHDMSTARYFRTRATAGGWETVYFVPDRDTIPGLRYVDEGTLWYARLKGRRWVDLERIGHVDSAIVVRPGSTGLISRAGPMQFAVGRGSLTAPASTGSVMVFRREHPGKWRVDTLPVKGPPLYVSAPADNAPLSDPTVLPVAGIWEGNDWFPGSLLLPDASTPNRWRVLRRGTVQSMNNPMEIVVNGTLHTSWWEEAQDGRRASVWYQALDPSRENDPSGKRLVVAGMTNFTFLAVPEDGGARLVWAYQPASRVDSAEVAVVANGAPVGIGRVAFPFGFMTNGVTSGDRSFILATMPRPIPGEGPPASRTLEVRVDCRGAPGTSKGGTHEAPVEAAHTGRRTGVRRLRG